MNTTEFHVGESYREKKHPSEYVVLEWVSEKTDLIRIGWDTRDGRTECFMGAKAFIDEYEHVGP